MPELGVDTQQGQDGTHYIFQTAAIHPSTIQAFSAAQDRVTQDLRAQKSVELARQQVEEWAKQVRAGTPMVRTMQGLAVPVRLTYYRARARGERANETRVYMPVWCC